MWTLSTLLIYGAFGLVVALIAAGLWWTDRQDHRRDD
jgi:hypothetical protein